MKKAMIQRREAEQQTFFGTKRTPMPEGDGCHIVSVGKRRDGGTRYWVRLRQGCVTEDIEAC